MISFLYMALLGIMFVALSVHVIKARQAEKIALADGGSSLVQQRMRAHANFAEYTPFFLILLWAAESQGIWAGVIHAFGVAFALGRVLHAYSMLVAERYEGGKLVTHARYRVKGMQCTFGCIASLSIIILVNQLVMWWGLVS